MILDDRNPRWTSLAFSMVSQQSSFAIVFQSTYGIFTAGNGDREKLSSIVVPLWFASDSR